MAGAGVSMLVEPMISMIQQWLTEGISLVKGVEKKLEDVSSKLKIIQAVLDDAEKRSVQEGSVKVWLEELQDISFDMHDVLDEWNTTISKQKLEEAENPSNFPQGFLRCLLVFPVYLFSLFTCFPLKQVGMRRDVALKVQEIDASLNSIIEKKNAFDFVSKYPPHKTSVVDTLKMERITTSLIEESVIYGRDFDKTILLRKLLSENSQEVNASIPVISIVGLGGIGKTTLAKQVYNDDEVVHKFHKRIWVCVSDPFGVEKVAREIFAAVNGNDLPSDYSLDMVLTNLKRSISNVRFLLVLDDVWDEKGRNWEKLRYCLKDGVAESRILVTTRNQRVAEVMGTSADYLHLLGVLSEKDSWSLFKQIAFVGKNEEEGYVRFGKEIVKKCKGLPLAVRILGSLLHFKNNIHEWEDVLHSQIWQLEKAEEDLFPHFYLSYNELSPTIKRCFSYCSIFQKDESISVDDLIRMWIAQGYVVSTSEEDDMEQKGREYFNKLAMCCFFQDFDFYYYETIQGCKMHDLVHDFAQHLARKECIVIGDEMPKTLSKTYRHVAFVPTNKVESPLLTFCYMEKLRTYSAFARPLQQPHVLFSHLKRIRQLVLNRCDLKELPKEVGNLIHLRCLNLRNNNNLDQLPESMCELYNLQVLDITRCYGLSKLPQGIGKLINLRQLLMYHVELQEYPKSFEKLTNLWALSDFVVGKKFGKLEYLKNFKHLRGDLNIKFKDDLKEAEILVDAQNAQIKNNKYFQSVAFEFENLEMGTEAVWEALLPPSNLQSLIIFGGIYGNRYPSWLTKLLNLRRLVISGPTPNCTTLPPLWKLPNLAQLYVRCNTSLKHVGREFLGIEEDGGVTTGDSSLRRAPTSSSSSSLSAFLNLDWLSFEGLQEWEEWEDLNQEEEEDEQRNTIQIMPRLRWLRLVDCPKLKQFPHRLLRKASSLEELEIRRCGVYKDSEDTKSYCRQIKQLLPHIPKIIVTDRLIGEEEE